MLKNLSIETKFKIYLSILAIVGIIFVLIATSKYGAGVSSDAVRNLSTAENLLAGKGFVDLTGAPFLLWPPLYPLLLAGSSLITKWSIFQSGWYLNILLYALNIWIMGWFLFSIFKEKPAYAFVGALMILLSRSTLRLYANVASEPLFVTFMLIFFFAAAKYLKDASRRALWWMFIMAGLATLQRYLGVVLIGTAGLVVLYKEQLRGVWRAALPILASILPTLAWMVLHNYLVSGTFFGPRDPSAMLPLENISLSLTKILWWFIPRAGILDTIVLQPWIPIGIFALILILINKRANWADWLKSLSDNLVWPAILFSVVYYFVVAFAVVTADHLDLTSDRYYVIILPIVLTFLFITLDKLVFSHLHFDRRLVSFGLIAIVALWFVYPIYSIQEYLRLAVVMGEPTNYNVANSSLFREKSVIKAAQPIFASDPSAAVYTNYVNIVWFIFQRPVAELPLENPGLPREQRIEGLQKYYPNWPPKSGYIIFFAPNQYHYVAPPDEVAAIANLKLIYQDKTGQIYYVQAKSP